MSYVDNAPLITAWNNRVQALKDRFAALTDGSTTSVVIENTEETTLLSSMSLDTAQGAGGMVLTIENPELESNGQAPQVVIEQPTLEPEEDGQEEDQVTDEVTDEEEPSEETEEEVSEDTEE